MGAIGIRFVWRVSIFLETFLASVRIDLTVYTC
jgi:hypothetical protein